MLKTEPVTDKKKFQGKIKIAFASGKGGTGKTLVSTCFFQVVQQAYHNVALVDCDAEEPNDMIFFSGKKNNEREVTQKVPVIDEYICTFCGLCHEYCTYNAIFILPPSRIIKVFDELCHGCGACMVACEYGAIDEKEVPLGKISSFAISDSSSIIEARTRIGVLSPVPLIKSAINEASDYDIVIMDSPPGTSCPFIHSVYPADYVVLVAEPTPFGLSDLKQSVETLKKMHKNYGVIINRSGMGDRAIYKYLDWENIALLMEIPFDKSIATDYSKGNLMIHNKPYMKEKFVSIFNSISGQNGNSCN